MNSKCISRSPVFYFETFFKLKIGFYTSSNSKLHRNHAAFTGPYSFKDAFQFMYHISYISKSKSVVVYDSANSFVETVICVLCNICT